MSTKQDRTAASQRYIDKNYDIVNIKVRKPGREYIKQEAEEAGQSMRQFVIQAINAQMTGHQIE